MDLKSRLVVSIGAACALCLSGCAEGWEATDAEARNWLPEALPHLERVIVLLRTCQPKRQTGYNTIWLDGSNDDEPPHCAFSDDKGIEHIRTELKRAGVLGVSYQPGSSPEERVPRVEFILFREGMATSGSMTSVTYNAQPQPCVDKSEGDDRFRVTSRAITGAPCRWFWTRSEG